MIGFRGFYRVYIGFYRVFIGFYRAYSTEARGPRRDSGR